MTGAHRPCSESGHRERHDDGVAVIGGLHSHRDGRLRIGSDAEVDLLHQDAIALEVPTNDSFGKLAAAVTYADRGLRDLRVPQVFAAEFRLRNLVVVTFFDLVNREETLGRFGVVCDHSIVGLGVGVGSVETAATASSATLLGGGDRGFGRILRGQRVRLPCRRDRLIERVSFASYFSLELGVVE